MVDMITKGEGNSRFLKTSLAPGTTWEEALAQMIAGNFPVDFNGKNPDGILREGTPLNKGTLLSDVTALLIGDGIATPDDALAELMKKHNTLENSALQIRSGSYAGNNEIRKSISIGILPSIVFLSVSYGGDNAPNGTPLVMIHPQQYVKAFIGLFGFLSISWDTDAITLNYVTGTNTINAYNASGATYHWCAIGHLIGWRDT